MNKINVTIAGNETLDGYYNMELDQVPKITNGTCDEIICSVLDKLSYSDRVEAIVLLCRKLSDKGFLTLKFINGSKICKDCSKGNMNSEFLSNLIKNANSLFLESDIVELISQIEAISLHKTFNDNISTTVVLQKKL